MFLYLCKDEVLLCRQLLAQEEPQGRDSVGQKRDEEASSVIDDGCKRRRRRRPPSARSRRSKRLLRPRSPGGLCSPLPEASASSTRDRRSSALSGCCPLVLGQRVCCYWGGSGASPIVDEREEARPPQSGEKLSSRRRTSPLSLGLCFLLLLSPFHGEGRFESALRPRENENQRESRERESSLLHPCERERERSRRERLSCLFSEIALPLSLSLEPGPRRAVASPLSVPILGTRSPSICSRLSCTWRARKND